MNKDINLLAHQEDQSLIEKKRLKIFKNISFVFAGIVVFFSIVIFIVNATFSTASIKNQQESAINQITNLKDRSAKLFVVNNRILNISKIIKERNNYSSIESLLKLTPNSVRINNLNFSTETFSITLISSSLLPLDDLINSYIAKLTKKELIKSLTINSLSLNQKTGNYYLSIKAEFL
ncbi:MAG: hypothetical protein A2W22_06825 [Candidatus Levybacteria bacterium RBG_16_35_11]|nr:MAG: hypothetical protein A2W22_06825 [Candidatus Levybacteria bacterium RBG_16_35_11]